MFLDVTLQRNPALVDTAVELHAGGQIPPDTYLLDLDAITVNARSIAEAGKRYGVELWQVGKQFGRNPLVYAAIGAAIPRAAVIDTREIAPILAAGVQLANVGHLVQIPVRQLPTVLAHRPAHVTVIDEQNLRAVSDAAVQVGITQNVLLRVTAAAEDLYPGQDGGFDPEDVERMRDLGLPGIRIAGVTGFPCVLFDDASGVPRATATADRVLRAASVLEDPVINLPSHTSAGSLELLSSLGATVGEPGHALTGTTPEHAVNYELPEQPAIVYVSEVALGSPVAAVFGGGFYPRGHAEKALIVDKAERKLVRLHKGSAENIDYYRRFDCPGTSPTVGSTAVMAFRTQLFVVRSLVAVVSGISTGHPEVLGLFDGQGRVVESGR
ncbi:alanine racemase [Enemella sp. A6]|uniref:alanine racemase n=1 Tax=Enemella sp. A6 TaxID=3440152 RepID=UPI003EBCFB26